jgi:tetratricopeptide (TPR) repeat protein
MCRRLSLVIFLLLGVFRSNVFAKGDAWLEVRTPHFIVLSNAGEKESRRIADQFERMRAVFRKGFPTSQLDSEMPIIVLALKDKKGFQSLEPEAYLAKGQLTLAGLFMRAPDKNYVLLRLDAEGEHPYAAVYHEYTHMLMSHAEEWLPLWLNEGLAEFYQNTEIKDKEAGLGEASPENLMLLRQKRLLPLATLLTVDHNSPYYHEENKGSIFYAESWALTHYLMIKDRQDKTERLVNYANLVSHKVDSVTAATRSFGDLNILQKDLERYVSQGSFFYLRMPGATEVDDSAFKVRPITPLEADAARADFLAYSGREKDARPLLDQVLREDPKNVSANETMGYLAFRDGKMDEAEKWYGQAVKLDSQSYLAHYYYATIALREGMSAEGDAQIDASLRAAIKLNPSFAPAFDVFAMFLGMRHKDLDEARTFSLRAIELDPDNLGYRFNAANLHMERQHPEDAIAVLQGAAKAAKDPQQAAEIQSRIASIQHYQSNREEMREGSHQGEVQVTQDITPTQEEPPDDGKHGPRRSVKGTIREVKCLYPSIMKLRLDGPAKALELRSRNYFKVEYTALNFTPSGDLNPCKDLEGIKAKVDYFEGASDSVPGQIIAIEMTK